MIRLVISSDYPMVRAGLQAMLAACDDLAVVGQSAAGDLSAVAADLRPDVVVLDLAAGAADLALIGRLTQDAGVAVVALSGSPSGDFAAQALAAGARGYLFKDAAAEELAAAVRAAHQGLVTLHPAAVKGLFSGATRPESPAAPETLSPRELEVLALVAQGLPNKIIATKLHLSEHTVKFHVAAIMGKLGAASRTEAVSLAARQGLIAL